MADRSGPRVGVIGAAGGIGATTVACGLALAWAVERGLDPWLIELDETRGDLAARWDLPDERTVSDLAAVAGELGPEHLRRAAVTHRSGAVVLLAPRSGEPVDGDAVDGMLRSIDPGCPVVFDLGAGLGDAARRAARRCSTVLMVAPSSTRGARLARRLMRGLAASADAAPGLVAVATRSDDLSPRSLARAVGVEGAVALPRAGRQAARITAGEWPGHRRRGLGRPLLALAEEIA